MSIASTNKKAMLTKSLHQETDVLVITRWCTAGDGYKASTTHDRAKKASANLAPVLLKRGWVPASNKTKRPMQRKAS